MNVDSLSWEAAELEVMRFMNPELELSGGSLTRGWPLVSLREASLTVAAYLAFVVLGSAAMRRLPAPAGPILTSLMATYNATQVVLCFYMAAEAIRQYWALGYRPTCNNELVLVPGQPFEPTGMSEVLWVFYVSKILDFLDTIFIVIRKRTRQLSFLHVFHHMSIFVVYWINISIAYNGDGYLAIILNSCVHFVMYSYYLIVAVTGRTPAWKRYVTHLQMAQFVVMMSQGSYSLWACPDPGRRVTQLYVGYIAFLFALFAHFSSTTYGGGRNKTA